MALASVRRAAEQAARRGWLLPHELSALSLLDELLPEGLREEFSSIWRCEGSPAAPVKKQES